MVYIPLRALGRGARPVLLLLALAPAIGHATPAPPPPQVFARSQVEVAVAPYRQSTLQHVAWRKRDGAPLAAIAMAQDRRGMLWFANYEGLHRFDGVRFDRVDAVDGNKLLTTDVSAVIAYGDALWVGYRCGGVSVFERCAVTHYREEQGLFRWRVQLATACVAERMQERLDERTRIARTLHDSFLQSVQVLIMRFDRIKRGIAADPLQREIDSALDTADAAPLEGREQVWALRSGDEAQPGLPPALQEAAAACGQQYGVAVRVAQQGLPVPLPDSVQREVHAIALEALHNACRHSGAATVQVALRYAQDGVELRVVDGGCGIDDRVLADGAPHGRWSLAGMRERAHLVKASLRISRPAGGGTEVRLNVPWAS